MLFYVFLQFSILIVTFLWTIFHPIFHILLRLFYISIIHSQPFSFFLLTNNPISISRQSTPSLSYILPSSVSNFEIFEFSFLLCFLNSRIFTDNSCAFLCIFRSSMTFWLFSFVNVRLVGIVMSSVASFDNASAWRTGDG